MFHLWSCEGSQIIPSQNAEVYIKFWVTGELLFDQMKSEVIRFTVQVSLKSVMWLALTPLCPFKLKVHKDHVHCCHCASGDFPIAHIKSRRAVMYVLHVCFLEMMVMFCPQLILRMFYFLCELDNRVYSVQEIMKIPWGQFVVWRFQDVVSCSCVCVPCLWKTITGSVQASSCLFACVICVYSIWIYRPSCLLWPEFSLSSR